MKRFLFAVKVFKPSSNNLITRRVPITAVSYKIAWEMVVNYMEHFLSGKMEFLEEITLITIEEC